MLTECVDVLWCEGHLFNAAAGLYAGVFVFDYAVLHTIGTGVAVYLLMVVAPRYALRSTTVMALGVTLLTLRLPALQQARRQDRARAAAGVPRRMVSIAMPSVPTSRKN